MKTKHLLLLALLPAIQFFSCQPDDTTDPATPSDPRDVYVASWNCTEHSSQIGTSSYVVHINKDSNNVNNVKIENFYNMGFQYQNKATVGISGNTMTIAQQTINGNQVHGSGTKTGTNSISMTYYVNNGSTIDTCTATLSR